MNINKITNLLVAVFKKLHKVVKVALRLVNYTNVFMEVFLTKKQLNIRTNKFFTTL